MISNDTVKEYIYNLPDEEKELLIRFRFHRCLKKQNESECTMQKQPITQ